MAGSWMSARCWWCRSRAARCSASSSGSPSAARWPRRSCLRHCGRSSSACRPSWWRWREWIAAEYCSTIARALTLVLPPGAARRLSGRKRRAVVRGQRLSVGSRRPRRRELTPAQADALRLSEHGARCASLPAAAAAGGHRIGQDRGLPARRRPCAGAGPWRDRARARDRADAADRRALRPNASARRSPCCTRACARESATRNGGGCARGRRACAWARARLCSRRSSGSG